MKEPVQPSVWLRKEEYIAILENPILNVFEGDVHGEGDEEGKADGHQRKGIDLKSGLFIFEKDSEQDFVRMLDIPNDLNTPSHHIGQNYLTLLHSSAQILFLTFVESEFSLFFGVFCQEKPSWLE